MRDLSVHLTVSSVFLNTVPTLDDETEAEASEGQVGKHGLLLRLAPNVTLCIAVVELEGQRELSGLNVLFDLREQRDKMKLRAANRADFSPGRNTSGCYMAAKKLEHKNKVFSLNFPSCLK